MALSLEKMAVVWVRWFLFVVRHNCDRRWHLQEARFHSSDKILLISCFFSLYAIGIPANSIGRSRLITLTHLRARRGKKNAQVNHKPTIYPLIQTLVIIHQEKHTTLIQELFRCNNKNTLTMICWRFSMTKVRRMRRRPVCIKRGLGRMKSSDWQQVQ